MRGMFQRFMYGRYGNDQLNIFLLLLYIPLYLLTTLTQSALFSLLANICIFLAIFRTLSRNLPKRREENAKFMKKMTPVIRWAKLSLTIAKDKEHRYFKCPNCGQQLRVPKGKGKITITCRSCGVSFDKKT